jgi:hypothetical protein
MAAPCGFSIWTEKPYDGQLLAGSADGFLFVDHRKENSASGIERRNLFRSVTRI